MHDGSRRETRRETTTFALVDALLVLGAIVLAGYVAYLAVAGAEQRRRGLATARGRWEAAHYGKAGTTRVVARKVAPGAGTVLDEHVIETIRDDDPDYDAKFLDAMSRARARAALLQSEE